MEDSTNDLNQNEDVIPHSGELRQEIAPKTEEIEYIPGSSGERLYEFKYARIFLSQISYIIALFLWILILIIHILYK